MTTTMDTAAPFGDARPREDPRLLRPLDPQLLLRAFEDADFGIVVFDAHSHRIRQANAMFARERGYRPEEMCGLPADALYPAELVAERRTVRAAIDSGTRVAVVTEQITRGGRRFPVRLDCTVLRDAIGRPDAVIVYARDISAERQASRDLQLAGTAFEAAQPMAVLDAERRVVRINGAFTGLTGYLPKEVVGRAFPVLRSNRSDAAYVARRWEVLAATGFWQGEEWIRTKDGDAKIVHRTFAAVRGPDGRVLYYVGSLHDLTRERGALASLDQLTFTDPLTGLPNQAFLRGQLQHALEPGAAATSRVLLLADVDQFKRVNELYGHASGDALLVQIARRLQQHQGPRGLMCRLEGDTFAWLAPACGGADTPPGGACALAESLRAALAEPFELANGVRVAITACMGWAELERDGVDADAALEVAELALGEAKAASGAGHLRRYSSDMRTRKLHREQLIRELQAALTGQGLALYPQLQVDGDGRAVGAEALLRWTRTNGEQVPPEEFIPLAAQGRLLDTLDGWVLDHACELLADWAHKPALAGLTLAANVSAWRFQQPRFVEAMRERLERTGANPAHLQLEITESAALGDFSAAADKLQRLRALGIRIALDDFGIGYSSMTYLTHLPLDQLKIDQSFVADVPLHSGNTVLVESIIAMAHGFGLEVVAEGVETVPQETFLRAHGCDVFQGYLHAKPMPVDAFEAMLLEDHGTRCCDVAPAEDDQVAADPR